MKKNCVNKILLFATFFLCCFIISPKSFSALDCKNFQYPFYPALLKPSGEGTLNVTDFKSPRSCRACHILNIKDWDGSSHSHAFSDPIFLAMWKMAGKETQGKTHRFCVSCHSPIGLVTQDIKSPDDETNAKQISKQGVSCDFCHTVNLAANSTNKHSPLTVCRHTVSGTVSLSFRTAFHLSLTVLVHYRSLESI